MAAASNRRIATLVAVALTSFALPIARAHAQAPTPAPTATAASAAAEVQFTKGRQLKKAGKWEQACAAFEQSQHLDPQIGTLYNIAECDAQLGKLASAWAAYRDIAARDTNTARRDKSSALAHDLEPRLSKLLVRVDGAVPGLVITMNGVDITRLAGVENPVDVGTYDLAATAPSFTPWQSRATVTEEGKTVTVAIALQRVPSADATVDTSRATPPTTGTLATGEPTPPSDDEAAPHSSRRKVAIATAIGGGALIASGLIVGKLASNSWDAAKAVCGPDRMCANDADLAQATSLSNQASTRGTISTVLVGAGLATVGVSIYLWLTPHHEEAVSATAVRVVPAASPSSVGLSLIGGF